MRFFVILDGPMGAGKTTVTKMLRKKLPRTAILSWDSIKSFVSDFGSSPQDGTMVAGTQLMLAKSFMANDLNIIIDAGFARGERMAPFIKLAKQKKYTFLIYQFTASHRTLLKRALSRPKFEWEKKKITKANIEKNLYFYYANKYKGESIIINSDVRTPQNIVREILQDLSSGE